MSGIETFLLDLSQRDIQIWADGDRFRVRAAKGVLTPEIQNQLKKRKPEILAFLHSKKDREPAIRPAARQGRIPLSAAQLRLWFLDRLEGPSPVYNMPSFWHLGGGLMVTALEASLSHLVCRNESLRTVFRESDGRPEQVVHPPLPVRVAVRDLRGLDSPERERESRRIPNAEVHRSFDLEKGPLFRLELLRLDRDRHLMGFTLHHIVSDGWTMALLVREWAELYRRLAAGLDDPLPEPAIQYADFAIWQQARQNDGAWKAQLEFWQNRLEGLPAELTIATDRPRPSSLSSRGQRRSFVFDPHSSRALADLGRVMGATLFMSLEAVFAALLSRYSGQEDIAVGTVVANRNYREIQNVLGFFANTLVLRNDLSGKPDFRSLVSKTKHRVLAALANQDLPFERVVDALRPERGLDRSPLFQAMFVLEPPREPLPDLAGLSLTSLEPEAAASRFDLTLSVSQQTEGLTGFLEYNTDLFDAATIARMVGHLGNLIRSAVRAPGLPVSRLDLLAPGERAQALQGWNDTATAYPGASTLPAMVLERVRQMPDAIATVGYAENGTPLCLDFRALDRHAELLAARLRESNIGPGSVVAIFCERRPETVWGMLAVWKAGGAYLPLDTGSPGERLRFMLADADAAAVLSFTHHRERLAEFGLPVLCLDAHLAPRDRETNRCETRPEYPAYLIYTSGSTGRPKGVEIAHGSLTNMVAWNRKTFGLSRRDRTTHLANAAFDASVWELWPALASGSQVHLLDADILEDGETLRDWLVSRWITLSFVPTPLAEVLLSLPWPANARLRILQTAGDRLHRRPEPDHPFQLVNNYGPTENTVVATFAPVEAETHGLKTEALPSIGRPVANTQCFVLDPGLFPLPIGIAGELCLGGDGLAFGYRNRAALTAVRFVPHPFPSLAGSRLYRSGDRVRLCHDGRIDFLGRVDGQLKLRGFRIEPGEIENLLTHHPKVGEAAVVLIERGKRVRQLVAFLTCEGEGQDEASMRAYLRNRLPAYMVPSRLVVLDRLPLTSNGKVDRAALAGLALKSDLNGEPPRPETEGGAEPGTPAERELANIWCRLLGLRRVGIHDNFFELGGDSILAIQVVSRARKAGIHLAPKQLFERQTIAELADAAGVSTYKALLRDAGRGGGEGFSGVGFPNEFPALSADCAGIEKLRQDHPDLTDLYPLTPMQKGMLFHGLYDPGSGDYFEQLTCVLTGELDLDGFRRAWQAVIRRHEVLRTGFHWQGLGEPLQTVHAEAVPEWTLRDWRHLTEPEQDRRLAEFRAADRERGFAFDQAPLMRLALFELGSGRYRFLWSYHHLLLDGWSLPRLMRDLLGFYEAFRAGRNHRAEPPPRFRNYLKWLDRQDAAEAKAFWVAYLAGFRGPTPLPGFARQPDSEPGDGLHGNRFLELPAPVAERLMALVRRHRLTLNTVVQAAWSLLLGGYGAVTDVVFGATVSGRPAELDGVEEMVGLFINTLPVRVRFEPSQRLAPWLDSLQSDAAERSRFEFSALGDIRKWHFGSVGDARNHGLFQSLVIFENYPVDASLQQWRGSLAFDRVETFEQTNYPLNLIVRPAPTPVLQLSYDQAFLDGPCAERVLADLQSLLASMAADPRSRLGDLPLPARWETVPGAMPAVPRSGSEPREPGREALRPQTQAERVLARIWEKVLHLERVGIHDNYFALGGDSILSIQIVSRAKAEGLILTPKQIFELQTIAALAEAAGTDDAEAPEQGAVSGPVPLTPIQRWFLDKDPAEHHHFNQAVLLATDAALEPVSVKTAVRELSRHHDALRLRFRRQAEGWIQFHAEPESALDFEVLDVDPDSDLASLVTSVAGERQAGLDLERGPVGRAVLFHRSGNPGRLLIVIHHLVVDGVSWRILLEDLTLACEQSRSGEAVRFPPKTTSFKAWAQRQANALPSNEEKAYWLRLGSIERFSLPIDYPADPEANTQALAATLSVTLGPEPTESLLARAGRAYRTRVDDLLLAALTLTLTRHFHMPHLLLDLEDHGRDSQHGGPDLTRTVGWFTALFPVLLTPGDCADLASSIKAVKEQLRAVPNRGTGFGRLRYSADAATRAEMATLPRPEILFNYLGRLDRVLDEGGLFSPASEPTGQAVSPRAGRNHLLEINSYVRDGCLHLAWAYSRNFHDRATVREWAGAYLRNLERIVAHCLAPEAGGVTPSDFPLACLDGETLDRLFRENPDMVDLYPLSPMQEGMLFHDLYERGKGVYFVQVAVTLSGELDPDAFRRAWDAVLGRHTLLRTGFLWDDLVKPLQAVHRQVSPSWDLRDWSALDSNKQGELLKRFRGEDRERGFELDRAPLMRFALFRLAEERHYFVWSHHHLLLDGWSLPHLLNEVFKLYASFRENREPRLPRPTPFRSYIAWLQNQDIGQAEAFWRRTLAGFAAPTPLPGEWGRVQADEPHRIESVLLSETLTASLQRMARDYRLTLSTLVQGAWALLLGRHCHETEVTFGVTVSGRPPELAGVESLMGLLINTLPVRVKLPGSARLSAWLEGIRQDHAAMMRFAYSALTDVQGWSEVPRGTPLFESIVVFENYPVEGSLLGDCRGLKIENPQIFERTNFPLTLVVQPGDRLSLALNFDPGRFRAEEGSRLVRRLAALLQTFADAPGRRLSRIAGVDAGERAQLLAAWYGNRVEIPCAHTLHQRFESVAARNPDRVALVFRGTRLSYAQLNGTANRLAHLLRGYGLGPDRLAGLCLSRSPETAIGILAILKAGGAYLPLDPAHPMERLVTILDDAQPLVLVTGPEHSPRFGGGSRPVVDLERDAAPVAGQPQADLGRVMDPECLAYAIYTSGSTGRPKGVAVTHANVTRLLDGAQRYYGFSANDVWPLFHSYAFDVSVWELWGAFLHGGRLLVVSYWRSRTPEAMVDLVYRERVTVLNQTPSAFGQFMRAEAEHPHPEHMKLRLVIFAGEALDPPRLKPWFSRHGDRKPLLANMYGITETTVHVTYYRVAVEDTAAERGLVGLPLPDLTVSFLDRHLHPVPAEVPGEMYVGGAGLARGYLARPELTAERFLPDPHGPRPGRRLYRSGDQARYLPQGRPGSKPTGATFEYLGRLDHQVKIRGFRIELGEIETALAAHPAVAEAVVLFRKDQADRARLVGYAQVAGSEQEKDRVETGVALRAYLAQKLPDYMVPAAIVVLPAIPLTPNGKVDRRALPAPDLRAASVFVAPRLPVELKLADIWTDILKLQRVGIHDNFFECGGHSLLATRVVSRIRRDLGAEISIRTLFACPTIAQLAAAIAERKRDRARAELPPVEPVPRVPGPEGSAQMPLSFAQRRLWFLERVVAGSPNPAYNMPCALRLTGPLDCLALERSLFGIVERHEILRTSFPRVDGEPVQSIAPFRLGQLTVEAFPTVPGTGLKDGLQARIDAEARLPFDLEHGPLLRMRLLRLAPQDHVLLLTLHHIVADGWSAGIMVTELSARYEFHISGSTGVSPLPGLAVQYSDFACWQEREWQGGVLAGQLVYWRGQLAGVPPILTLPTDRPRPRRQSFRGGRLAFEIDSRTAASLEKLGREAGATTFMVLHATWAILLSRYSGQTDIAVGSPIANRTRAETEGLIGFFANTLVFRHDCSGDPGFFELLARVRQNALDAFENQDLPFERVVEALQPDRDLGVSPLFQAMLVLQNAPLEDLALENLHVEPLETFSGAAKFDMLLEVAPGRRAMAATWEYNADLFDATTVRRMIAQFQRLLTRIGEGNRERLSRLPLLSKAERHQSTRAWSQVDPRPRDADFLIRVEERVSRVADAVALAHGSRHITYASLHGRANGLAAVLRARGFAPGRLAAIGFARSPALAVALLAVLRAGGAYLPLDPAYPRERLAFMLSDSGASFVLTRQGVLADLPGTSSETIDLDRLPKPSGVVGLAACHAGPDDLAYLLYTSGSTGLPKGVAMRRGALADMVSWQLRVSPKGFKTLQFAALGFDIHFQEFFATWSAGECLVLIDEELRRDPRALLRKILEERIERLFLPYVALHLLAGAVEALEPDRLPIREINTAGEALRMTPAISALMERLGPRSLSNHYGPTEGHVVTAHNVCPGEELPPIGRPAAGACIYLLDRWMQPVPIRASGELYIGGNALARGYFRRPAATAEKFVPDHFSDSPGARLYRTGDLARHRYDGAIEFLGRGDDQVKLRGIRIELGEIETVLGTHPAVGKSAVAVREDGSGEPRLTAYCCLTDSTGFGQNPESALRRFLARKLPEPMIPSVWVFAETLPMSPSGKIDRRALPAPSPTRASTIGEPPRNPVEATLAAIWCEVLHRESVGVHDNFFQIGGHSLLATRMTTRVREAFSVELPLNALFEAPTVAALAERISFVRADRAPVRLPHPTPRPVTVDNRVDFPLSPAQQRLWFLSQMQGTDRAYNLPFVFRFDGWLDAAALHRAAHALTERHETLRTTIRSVAGEPSQHITVRPEVDLPVIGLFGENQVRGLAETACALPFDLENGPLWRLVLLRWTPSRHFLILSLHHIIADGWSLEVMVRELAALYRKNQESPDGPLDLPPLPIQYADYAIWQRDWLQGPVLADQIAYWRRKLEGAPRLITLHHDRPRPPQLTFDGATVPLRLGTDLTRDLERMSRDLGITMHMMLLGCFAVQLARYSGQDDLVVGSAVANRRFKEIEGLIGFFVNTLALRLRLPGLNNLPDLASRVRETALAAYGHQDVPFEQVVEALQPERNLSHAPIFQVSFSLQNAPMETLHLPGLTMSPLVIGTGSVKFDLSLSLAETDRGIQGVYQYNRNLFDEATVARMPGHFRALAEGMLAEPHRSPSRLGILTEAETRQLILDWNETGMEYRDDQLVHLRVERNADRAPDAVAVSFEGRDLTYGCLNGQANQLARGLNAMGISREAVVGIYIERSLEMITGKLAVLKAGGAYLPIDPSFPRDRVAFMVADAGISVGLAHGADLERFPLNRDRILAMDEPRRWLRGPSGNLGVDIDPGQLAYLIYTSGSTGLPKGVGNVHKGLVNLVSFYRRKAAVGPGDRVIQAARASFDVSVWEIWSTLIAGANLRLVPPMMTMTPEAYREWLLRHWITLGFTPPAVVETFLAMDWPARVPLRQLLSGGDRLNRYPPPGFPFRIVNSYGPSEDSVMTTYAVVEPEPNATAPPPIGWPIANQHLYILSRHAMPVPVHVSGELHIGGIGLARGYASRPGLTAEKFVPNPFDQKPGGRLYRTGDLVRYRTDGQIEFLDRIDQQVKLRGFRIELGEIEAVLSGYPGVVETVVVKREDQPGNPYLAAYFAGPEWSAPESDEPNESLGSRIAELRQHLKNHLPDFMVPAFLVPLARMPLTANGKIDRKALPEPGIPVREVRHVAPRNEVEARLAEIWQQALRADQGREETEAIGVKDNFFDIGGHSLLATKVMATIRQSFGVALPLENLFEEPTIERLAELIGVLREPDSVTGGQADDLEEGEI